MEETLFENYKARLIQFYGTNDIAEWKVKIYTITLNNEFESTTILKHTIDSIPDWIKKAENSKLPTYQIAFLIVHEAREGVWLLFCRWTGGEMIETDVYFVSYENPTTIISSPYSTSALVCVWELEVFTHERKAWIEHILKNADKPDFKGYLRNTLQIS